MAARAVAARTCEGGELDGLEVPAARVAGAFAWIDVEGRCHDGPAVGRWLYWTWGRDRLRFGGYGARCCPGCGAHLSPDALDRPLDSCPLCGADV